MRILVTGGAGFIGSHLVDALVRRGDSVRIIDNLQPQVHRGVRPSYLNPSAEYRFEDILDETALGAALEGIDAVVHLAALVGVGQSMYQAVRYVEANSVSTAKLLNLLTRGRRRPIQKLVVASSMAVYGEGLYRCSVHGAVVPGTRQLVQLQGHSWEMACQGCSQVLTPLPTPEDKPLLPASVYAVSKRDQEELCLVMGRAYGLPTAALRFFNVYGPRQSLSNPYTGACAIFSARIRRGKPPILYEDGRQIRDFVHVSDVVQAIRLALDRPELAGRAFNVGTGEATSVAQIAHALAEAHGFRQAPKITGRFRAGDIRHCFADVARLSSFGFRPQVSLQEGLQDLVRWGQTEEAEDLLETAEQELIERNLLGE